MNKVLICQVLFFLLLVSCSREPIQTNPLIADQNCTKELMDPLTGDEVRVLAQHFSSNRVSEEDAMETAMDIIQLLDSNPITRVGGKRHLDNVSILTNKSFHIKDATKSGYSEVDKEDTLAYAVSFGDGLGYAILSADRRTDAILAVCSEGNPDTESVVQDTTSGAYFFYANLENFIEKQIEEAKDREDLYLADALAKIEADTLNVIASDDSLAGTKCIYYFTTSQYGAWSISGNLKPLVNLSWSQGVISPQGNVYNALCPVIDGKHAPVGCEAVAAAQVMAYWEYPSWYNWMAMKERPSAFYVSVAGQNDISRLLRDIGLGSGMKYKLSGSGTVDSKIVNYFRNVGYKSPGRIGGYNDTVIAESLNRGVPVMVGGYQSFFGTGGHEWIIDGYNTLQRTVTVTVRWRVLWWHNEYTYSYNEYCPQFHCNFGWGGRDNGYYNSKAFNTSNGSYNWWVNCIYDIVP